MCIPSKFYCYEPIQDLVVGSTVCSLDQQGNTQISQVKRAWSYVSPEATIFKLQDDVIVSARYQKYYIPSFSFWLNTQQITADTKLCSLSFEEVDIKNVAELHGEVELFDIELEDIHTFFVTKQDIVVHNFPAFVIGISFAFGGGVTFEGIKAGLCIAGVWLGTKILKKEKDSTDSDLDIQVTMSCGGSPDPDDEDRYKKLIYEDASYHHQNSRGVKSPSPKNGQRALDSSISVTVKGSLSYETRIGIEGKNFVVFMEHEPGRFHGHIRSWGELTPPMKNTLYDAGIVKNIKTGRL